MLQNKVVFLTGGASAIVRKCAPACAWERASLGVVDIDAPKAEATAAELRGETLAVACDVSDWAAVERAVAAALDRFGRIGAVHNKAGIAAPAKPLDGPTEAEWGRLPAVNLKSVFWTVRAALPALKQSRGAILNTASMYLDQIHALGYCPRSDVIGDAAVFLLTHRARFITGWILPVSGGAELAYRR
jgi:NAD(P)-dependent dehydrogenase (short-subunit alcohol dehydrogenase family)